MAPTTMIGSKSLFTHKLVIFYKFSPIFPLFNVNIKYEVLYLFAGGEAASSDRQP